MVDSQTHINTHFPTTESKIELVGAAALAAGDKLQGKLVIKNYPNLTEINLNNQELTELVIINCPELKKVIAGDNKLVKCDIEKIVTDTGDDTGNPTSTNNKLEELAVVNNVDLTEISLRYCLELMHFYASGIPKLDKVWALDKLKKLQIVSIDKGLTNHVFPEKLEYWRDLTKIVRDYLGLTPEQPLPLEDYDDAGVKRKRIDEKKLKNLVKEKVIESSPLKTEKETAVRERDVANAKLEAQKDYDTIKNKRDELIGDLQKIISELGLADGADSRQILAKIQELKGKPDLAVVTEKDNKIVELNGEIDKLKKEAAKQKEVFNKESVVKTLNIPVSQKEQLLVAASSEEFGKNINSLVKDPSGKENNDARNLNILLGVVLAISLSLLVWLLFLRKTQLAKDKELEEKNLS